MILVGTLWHSRSDAFLHSNGSGNATNKPKHSSRPVVSSAAWTAAQMRAAPELWKHPLTKDEILELETGAKAALADGRPLERITSKADFSLPTLGPRLEAIRQQVSFGIGFGLITGIPVEVWPHEVVVAAYWLIGLHWGRAVANNRKGHLIGHIKDIGHDPTKPDTRLYATAAPQPYHNDGPADLVSLLCLHNAKEGGQSHWSSSMSIYNEILRSRPELIPVLCGPWYFDRKGEVPPGKLPYFEIPVFNFYKGNLSVNYSPNYYFDSQRYENVPRLTPAHLEAIRELDRLAACDEFRMDYYLQPGDIQLLSNHVCLHSRGGFVDHTDPQKKRWLLRLWLVPPDERPLPPSYADLMGGSVDVSTRGGIMCDESTQTVQFQAE